jgi:hypothetical protein
MMILLKAEVVSPASLSSSKCQKHFLGRQNGWIGSSMHRYLVRVACKIEQLCCLLQRFHPSNAASNSSKVSPMLLSLHVSPEAGLACSSIAASKRPASQGGGWLLWPIVRKSRVLLSCPDLHLPSASSAHIIEGLSKACTCRGHDACRPVCMQVLHKWQQGGCARWILSPSPLA